MNDFLTFGITAFFILSGIALITRASGVGKPKSELAQCISECKTSFYQSGEVEARSVCIESLCNINNTK